MNDTINPASQPITVSLDTFRQSLIGSWIVFLERDPLIASQTFQPDGKALSVVMHFSPDREVDLSLPSIIIQRLGETFGASRTGNYFTSIKQNISGEDVETSVYAYRLSGIYQFDVLTRDLDSQFKITSYLDRKFWGNDTEDDQGDARTGVKKPGIKFFRVKDFSQRDTLQDDPTLLPDTDVCVYWRPHKDIKFVESNGFNTEFEQVSYTVEFWCDLWYTEHDQVITSIIVDETRFTL